MVTFFTPEKNVEVPASPPRSSSGSVLSQEEQDEENLKQLQAMLEERRSSRLSDCIGCGNPEDANNNNSSSINDAFTMRNWSFTGVSYMEDLGALDEEEDELNKTQDVSYLSRNSSSLAKMDSLALQEQQQHNPKADDTFVTDDADASTIVEHSIPDYRGARRRKRKMLLITACCLMIGIVVVTTILALYLDDGSVRSKDITVNDGSNAESSVSENIFNLDELPEAYYILEPKVSNASALLDYNTVEGRAFHSIAKQADAISYNDAAGDTAKSLDLIQRYGLMTLYFGADGEGWNLNDGWTEESDVCLWWHGVDCKNSVVTSIVLDNNNLKGSIPNDFCLLQFLESMSMSGNNRILLPWCTANMGFLSELFLKGNGYEGNLPGNLHQMESLTHLDLSDNAFSGSVRDLFPSNINDQVGFPLLETLNLNNNELSGEIPESSFRRMGNLQTLSISGNPQLTGSLNEICKGSLMFGEADCQNVACRCCQSGTSCPSF